LLADVSNMDTGRNIQELELHHTTQSRYPAGS